MQGGSAAQCFLRSGVRLSGGVIGETKRLIGRREDVLDFRACLCLEHRNGVDQNRLVREELARRPEFREHRAGGVVFALRFPHSPWKVDFRC